MLLFYLLLVMFPFVIPVLEKMNVTLLPSTVIDFFMNVFTKMKKEREKGSGMVSPAQVASSLCFPSERRRDLVASSEAMVYCLLSITAPGSSDLGRARSIPHLGFHVEEVSVFTEGLQSEPQRSLKP